MISKNARYSAHTSVVRLKHRIFGSAQRSRPRPR
jgi:hypothetical protein